MKIEIRDIDKNLLKTKHFKTSQCRDEYWNEFNISNCFLIENEWYTIVSKMKQDKDRTYFVSKGRRL